MATALDSSTLAWKLPWTEEPGGLPVHGVAKSRTRLSNFTFTFHFHALEKEMATHSISWRIPGMGEPGELPSMGSHRVKTGLEQFSSSSSSITVPVQFSLGTQSCPTRCAPMDCSTRGLPVHYQLLKFTHIHWVSDTIQTSHPLSSPSPAALNLSQDQGLFQWVSSWHQVAKVLEFPLQHQSFQWIFRIDFLQDGLVGSPCSSKGLSRVFSNTTVQKHQFFSAQLSL